MARAERESQAERAAPATTRSRAPAARPTVRGERSRTRRETASGRRSLATRAPGRAPGPRPIWSAPRHRTRARGTRLPHRSSRAVASKSLPLHSIGARAPSLRIFIPLLGSDRPLPAFPAVAPRRLGQTRLTSPDTISRPLARIKRAWRGGRFHERLEPIIGLRWTGSAEGHERLGPVRGHGEANVPFATFGGPAWSAGTIPVRST